MNTLTSSSLFIILSIFFFISCSSGDEPIKEEVPSTIYTIELEKFGITIDGDYKNAEQSLANTIGINKALRYAKENGYVDIKFPKGFYPIVSDWGIYGNPNFNDPAVGIVVPSDVTLDMTDATFRLHPNKSYAYAMFSINNVKNVKLIGGHIIGDRYEHINIPNPDHPSSKTYEWGHGIVIVSSQDITVDKVKVEQMTGDAVSISRYPYTPKEHEVNRNVTISNCDLSDCRRQGITISKGFYTTIKGNRIYNILNGTLPMNGILLEELTVSGKAEECMYTEIYDNHVTDVVAAIASNRGDHVKVYNNKVDNWIWMSENSRHTRVYNNTFLNGYLMIYMKSEDGEAYDNVVG